MTARARSVTTGPAAVRRSRLRCASRLSTDRAGRASSAAPRTRPCGGPTPRPRRRSGWPGSTCPRTSRPLLAEIDALRAELAAEGLDRVVLCGMGGSSLAPEVICAHRRRRLDRPRLHRPGRRPRRARRPARAHRGGRVQQVRRHGGDRQPAPRLRAGVPRRRASTPADRIVVVTDPGSPLREAGRRGRLPQVFLADPDVGGRYSALTAFGLVPSGLAGADIGRAARRGRGGRRRAGRRRTRTTPACVLARCDRPANAAARQGRARRRRTPASSGFGDWAEQLIAESTGKHGNGHAAGRRRGHGRARGRRRPRRRGRWSSIGSGSAVRARARRPSASSASTVDAAARRPDAAVGVRHRGRRPAARHQPVRPARRRERQGGRPRTARAAAGSPTPAFTDGGVEVARRRPGSLDGVDTVAGAVEALLAQLTRPTATWR